MSWTSVALGEICSPKQHKTIPTSVLLPDGYPVFGANGQIGFYSEYTHAEETVAITCRGATCGTINVAPAKSYITGNAMALDKLDRARVDLRFFVYALRHRGMHDVISGSAQPQITRAPLLDITIPLPPLDEQKRIAAILDQADELRRKRQRAIDRLNQLRQAIFHEMFGDFVANPMGWSTIKLGDACGVGSSKRVFVEEFVDDGVPFYRGTEVGKLATGDLVEPDLFIAPNHYADLIAHSGKPEIGDLLLPSICHDGRIWRVDSEKPFYFKDGRVLWIKKDEAIFDSEYLRNHLRNAFLTNYHTIASGTTFAELKIVNLKGLSVLCPPLKLQVEFSKRIREVETTSLKMAQSASFTNALFASLQHLAFRGEL
jgi:type I restriction enzyme S subunit